MKLLFIALMEVVECLLFPDITGWNNFTLVEEPFLPTVKEIDDMEAPETAARWHVWMLVMLGIAFLVAVAGTLILKCAERGPQTDPAQPGGDYAPLKVASRLVSSAAEQDSTIERSTATVSFKPRTLKVLLAISLTITFSTSFAALAWSSRTGRLSKDCGADWEVYAGLLACSGLALVLQALIMARRLPPGEKFGTTAFAQACITGMAPVLSDQYDTMKDVMFAFLCMQSEHVEIQAMGIFSLLWLVGVHAVCFAYEDTTAELLASHLSVLLLTPDTGAGVAFRDELLVLLYKQLTPTKRFLLLLENVPQAICAIIFLRYEGGSVVVTMLSLAIPALQIGLAFLLYGAVRAQVAPYFGRRLRALISAGDQLLAQRLWREADFESDRGLFRQAVAFMHCKEIGAERYDTVISLWKVALDMHSGLGEEQWDLSDLGLKEEVPLVEAFFAELAASECQKLDVDLSQNQLGDAGVSGALARAFSGLKKLQNLSLNLEMCGLGAEGTGALAGTIGGLVELQKLTLNLKGNRLRRGVSGALARAFSGLKKLQNLSLNLEMCGLGEECALSLLEALRATHPAASQLDLGDNDIGKGAVALARALRSGEVSCHVTHPVVEMLLREEFKDEEAGKLELNLRSKQDFGSLCQALPLLRLWEVELHFADLGLGDQSARTLATSLSSQSYVRKLSLNLSGSQLGEGGVVSLLEALRATRPASVQLNLGDTDIGQGAVALAGALRSGKVQGRVTHPVVEFLVQLQDERFKELKQAQKLELDFKWRGEEFLKAFGPLCRALPKLPPLRELALVVCDCPDEARALASALAAGLGKQKKLQMLTLELSSVDRVLLGEEGAKAVASALRELTELRTLKLNLGRNDIGPTGAAAVAESLRRLQQLTRLEVDLSENGLGPAGATAMAESLRELRQLTWLQAWLHRNELGPPGAMAVVESLRKLRQLTLLWVWLGNNALGEEEEAKLWSALDALPIGDKNINFDPRPRCAGGFS
ncbi:Nlrc5 [Symbiodinium sp. CCMP2592]|nr:Nlrc5 [Symbiodinium sp. CCMP2592]